MLDIFFLVTFLNDKVISTAPYLNTFELGLENPMVDPFV